MASWPCQRSGLGQSGLLPFEVPCTTKTEHYDDIFFLKEVVLLDAVVLYQRCVGVFSVSRSEAEYTARRH